MAFGYKLMSFHPSISVDKFWFELIDFLSFFDVTRQYSFHFFPFELESWGSVNGGKLDFFPQFIDWPNRSIEFWKRIDRVLEINLKIKSSFFCIDLTHTFGFTLQFNKNNLKATNFIIQT